MENIFRRGLQVYLEPLPWAEGGYKLMLQLRFGVFFFFLGGGRGAHKRIQQVCSLTREGNNGHAIECQTFLKIFVTSFLQCAYICIYIYVHISTRTHTHTDCVTVIKPTYGEQRCGSLCLSPAVFAEACPQLFLCASA